MSSRDYPFSNNERIVRIIYNPNTINPSNHNLKANFVSFRYNPKTGKHELSCNRIEIDTLDNLRLLGTIFHPPGGAYYGLACIKASAVCSVEGLELAYTPILDKNPKNPSHCDIYDNTISHPDLIGEAQDAEIRHKRLVFVKLWKAYKDDGTLTEDIITPF
jgi:hypothetical protein